MAGAGGLNGILAKLRGPQAMPSVMQGAPGIGMAGQAQPPTGGIFQGQPIGMQAPGGHQVPEIFQGQPIGMQAPGQPGFDWKGAMGQIAENPMVQQMMAPQEQPAMMQPPGLMMPQNMGPAYTPPPVRGLGGLFGGGIR